MSLSPAFTGIAILVLFLFLARPGSAHAGYLDPGSGSTLVQGLIAVTAAIKRIWRGLLKATGLRRQ